MEIKTNNILGTDVTKKYMRGTYINESISLTMIDEDVDKQYPVYLVLFHGKHSGIIQSIGISDIVDLSRVYIPKNDLLIKEVSTTSIIDPALVDYDISILAYSGDNSSAILKAFNGQRFIVPDESNALEFLIHQLSVLGVKLDLHVYGSMIANNNEGEMDFQLVYPKNSISEYLNSLTLNEGYMSAISSKDSIRALRDKLKSLD